MLLEKLFGFYHVATEQSFTKASQKINVSQPNLSKYISALEKHFGKKLVYKQNKRIHLTDEGKVLYDTAKKMLEDYQRTEDLIRHSNDRASGPLRIGTGHGLSQFWFPKIFARFNMVFPDIKLLIVGTDKESDLIQGDFDIILSPRLSLDPEKYTQIPFHEFNWCFYSSKRYLDKHGTPKTLDDLHYHRLLSHYHKERHIFGNVAPYFSVGMHDLLPKLPDFAVNSGLALAIALEEGAGIGLLQRDAPYIKDLDLVPLDHLSQFPPTELFVYHLAHLEDSKKIQTFIKYFVTSFQTEFAADPQPKRSSPKKPAPRRERALCA